MSFLTLPPYSPDPYWVGSRHCVAKAQFSLHTPNYQAVLEKLCFGARKIPFQSGQRAEKGEKKRCI